MIRPKPLGMGHSRMGNCPHWQDLLSLRVKRSRTSGLGAYLVFFSVIGRLKKKPKKKPVGQVDPLGPWTISQWTFFFGSSENISLFLKKSKEVPSLKDKTKPSLLPLFVLISLLTQALLTQPSAYPLHLEWAIYPGEMKPGHHEDGTPGTPKPSSPSLSPKEIKSEGTWSGKLPAAFTL